MRSRSRRYLGIARSKLTSGAPSCSRALKRKLFSVRIGSITQSRSTSGRGCPKSVRDTGSVALRVAKEERFGPFHSPYTSQIDDRSVARTLVGQARKTCTPKFGEHPPKIRHWGMYLVLRACYGAAQLSLSERRST
jgi:hypothetical protein